MGLFNNPGPSVTDTEFDRVLNTMRHRHRLPADLIEDWKAAAQGYLKDPGIKRGMDAKELDGYMDTLNELMDRNHTAYRSVLPEFRQELEKAVKGSYGNSIGF